MFQLSVGDVWQLAAEISTHLEKLTIEIGIDRIQGKSGVVTLGRLLLC